MNARAVMSEGVEADAGGGWVMLLPVGEIAARDGRRFAVRDAEAIVAASQPREGGPADLPIDYEHQSEHPTRGEGGPKPAAGWIEALEVRDGAIFAKVQWTARAAKLIADREYRFISPVFTHRPTGEVLRVTGAGLTHRPALELRALASEEREAPPPAGLQRLAAAAGLGLDAGEEELVAFCRAARANAGEAAAPDPRSYVPRAAVEELMRDRGQRIARMSEWEAEKKADAAIMRGQMTPGMRDWAVALCRSDAAAFDAFVEASAAPYAHLSETAVPGGHLPKRSEGTVQDDTERAICRQLGIKAFTGDAE